MDSKKSKLFGALLFLPLAVLLIGTSSAQDPKSDDDKADRSSAPDLVITEDTQIALRGRTGKAVTGSCKYEDPLWEGKIALKNIGGAPVVVEPATRRDRLTPVPAEDRLSPVPTGRDEEDDDRPYHVRVYVPNNIELQAEARLSHDLDEFGQELLEIEIGRGKNKCRNYDAPPVFDENLSGRPGPIPSVPDAPFEEYGWRIKKIQHALIQKGYPLHPDGDFGPESARAALTYFKDRHIPPPPGIELKPLPPETVTFLLEALAIGVGEEDVDSAAITGSVGGGDECKRGVNLVPIYLEVDPDRQIKNENRSNNRVQFTVAIDCSNVAR
jgi:hypothetical protein